MKIKELRSLTGMTQSQFGGYLNIPLRTIQNWESGHRTPPEYVVGLIEYKIKKEKEMKKEREYLLEKIEEIKEKAGEYYNDSSDYQHYVERLEELEKWEIKKEGH